MDALGKSAPRPPSESSLGSSGRSTFKRKRDEELIPDREQTRQVDADEQLKRSRSMSIEDFQTAEVLDDFDDMPLVGRNISTAMKAPESCFNEPTELLTLLSAEELNARYEHYRGLSLEVAFDEMQHTSLPQCAQILGRMTLNDVKLEDGRSWCGAFVEDFLSKSDGLGAAELLVLLQRDLNEASKPLPNGITENTLRVPPGQVTGNIIAAVQSEIGGRNPQLGLKLNVGLAFCTQNKHEAARTLAGLNTTQQKAQFLMAIRNQDNGNWDFVCDIIVAALDEGLVDLSTLTDVIEQAHKERPSDTVADNLLLAFYEVDPLRAHSLKKEVELRIEQSGISLLDPDFDELYLNELIWEEIKEKAGYVNERNPRFPLKTYISTPDTLMQYLKTIDPIRSEILPKMIASDQGGDVRTKEAIVGLMKGARVNFVGHDSIKEPWEDMQAYLSEKIGEGALPAPREACLEAGVFLLTLIAPHNFQDIGLNPKELILALKTIEEKSPGVLNYMIETLGLNADYPAMMHAIQSAVADAR